MAYSPVDQGRLLRNRALAAVAKQEGVSPAQVAIAWLLGRGVSVIPKASDPDHVREIRAAADVALSSRVDCRPRRRVPASDPPHAAGNALAPEQARSRRARPGLTRHGKRSAARRFAAPRRARRRAGHLFRQINGLWRIPKATAAWHGCCVDGVSTWVQGNATEGTCHGLHPLRLSRASAGRVRRANRGRIPDASDTHERTRRSDAAEQSPAGLHRAVGPEAASRLRRAAAAHRRRSRSRTQKSRSTSTRRACRAAFRMSRRRCLPWSTRGQHDGLSRPQYRAARQLPRRARAPRPVARTLAPAFGAGRRCPPALAAGPQALVAVASRRSATSRRSLPAIHI